MFGDIINYVSEAVPYVFIVALGIGLILALIVWVINNIDYIIASVVFVGVSIGLPLLIVAVTSIAVFYLWNALLPDLFEWPRISLWQACGLNFLCAILFRTPQLPKKSTWQKWVE
jgi:hypothetical protein